jgi:hypothetical protein
MINNEQYPPSQLHHKPSISLARPLYAHVYTIVSLCSINNGHSAEQLSHITTTRTSSRLGAHSSSRLYPTRPVSGKQSRAVVLAVPLTVQSSISLRTHTMSTLAILIGLFLFAAVAGNVLPTITQRLWLKRAIAISVIVFGVYAILLLWVLSKRLYRLEGETVSRLTALEEQQITKAWLRQTNYELWNEDVRNLGGLLKPRVGE